LFLKEEERGIIKMEKECSKKRIERDIL